MRTLYYILSVSLLLLGCSSDDVEYATINGKVVRTVTGEGVANQEVIIMTRKMMGSGRFSWVKLLDSTQVVTDADGSFSVSLKNEANAFITTIYQGDENYWGSGIWRDFEMGKPVIIETDKFIKFKILVKNTSPFDENDFIHIEFYSGLSNVVRTGIENFGVENTHHPEEPLPGGGVIGAYDETSWTGTNVNSIVYYSVSETAEHFKIRWFMKKNGIETNGFTDEIPYDLNQINTFLFEY